MSRMKIKAESNFSSRKTRVCETVPNICATSNPKKTKREMSSDSDISFADYQPCQEPFDPLDSDMAPSTEADISPPIETTLLMEMKQELQNFRQNITNEIIGIKKMQMRILDELASLRRAMRASSPQVSERKILPPKPFDTLEEFLAFDQVLQESRETLQALEDEFVGLHAEDASKFVRNMWKRVISNAVATQCCYKNNPNKFKMIGTLVVEAMRGAFNRRYSENERAFTLATCKWLQTANSRLLYQENKEKVIGI